MEKIITDTGPLVAFLNHNDQFYDWAKEQLALLVPLFLTCEAVLTEAHYILRSLPKAQQALRGLIKDELIQIAFYLEDEISAVDTLLQRYENVPMSLADACLVRMSELFDNSTIWTIDGDFQIYRKTRRQVIPIIFPPDK